MAIIADTVPEGKLPWGWRGRMGARPENGAC